MSQPTPLKLRRIPILGQENIPSTGALLIPNRLRLLDLQQLEKLLEGRSLVYLLERNAAYSESIKAHLEAEHVQALDIALTTDNTGALQTEIQKEVKAGKIVIFLPPDVASQPGALTTVSGEKLDLLMHAVVPVWPLYILSASEVRLPIEAKKDAADTVMAFGKVQMVGEANVASYQEALMQLAEQCFSQNPILDRNLGFALLQGLKKFGSKGRLFDGKDDVTWGYDKVLATAIVLSKHIKSVTQKPRVGIILPPGFGAVVANLAVILAGKIPVNVNFTAGRGAVDSAIKQSGVDHYLTADLFVRKLQSFPWPPNRQLTFIERLLPQKKSSIGQWLILSKLLPSGLLASLLGISKKGGNREALLLFTSGSSGDPKGVALTHRNLLANVCQFGSRLNLNNSDCILGCLPLFHSFGCTVTLFYPMISGLNLAMYPTPLETKKLAELIAKHKVSLFISTPTFLRGFLKAVNPELLASLKIVVTGAEKLPKAVAEAFESRFGKKVYEGYGLTETAPASNVNLPDLVGTSDDAPYMPSQRAGSVGQLLPGLAVRITHPDTGEPLSVHQSGMVWFKGANVFEGYLNNQKKTDEVLKDGWFCTGDIGRMDSDGFLYIEGRLSRFSKIAGEMVPHETVEEGLVKALNLEGESTRRIAIIGVPDIEKGEALVLLTTLPGGSVQQEILDLRYKLLDRGMSPLWIPKKMVRVQDIPTLASGKLDMKACEKLAKSAI
jgi:acyl-[acyl-carrier-protein]-phospholipid O-acyltransferase / long-chain-fatty-acid--[acyl-carrier-protein] ligase